METLPQHIIVIRTLRRSSSSPQENDFPSDYRTEDDGNPYKTQSQVESILLNIGSTFLRQIAHVPYQKIAVVHSNKPSWNTTALLMDRIRRFSGYSRIEELGGEIDLKESETDKDRKIKAFLDEYFRTNKKILIIIGGLPWMPALIEEGLNISGTPSEMPLEEMQHMIPSGAAYSFIRK